MSHILSTIKKIGLVFAFMFFSSCIQAKNISKVDTANNEKMWKSEFDRFRKAVTNNDISSIKTFFDFPLENSNIWYMIKYSENEDMNRPFLERDLALNSKKIFRKEFVLLLKKIKVIKFSKGLNEDENAHSFLNKGKNSYYLSLALDNDVFRITYLEEEGGYESSYSFTFTLNSLGRMIIIGVEMAG